MLESLVPAANATILTIPTSAPASRRWDPTVAAREVEAATGVIPRVIPDLAAAVSRAGTLAPHGTVLVTGSVHTVGDAMTALGISAD